MIGYFNNKIIGGKINHISRICNLISLHINTTYEDEVFIHIQSFFRVVKGNRIITTSEDMYRCSEKHDKENFKWDVPGQSIFDELVEVHASKLFNACIYKIQINPIGDLIIELENGWVIQALIDTADNCEKYRIFDNNQLVVM